LATPARWGTPVCGFMQQLGLDVVFGLASQSLSEAERRPAGKADRNAGQLRITRSTAAFDVCHTPIIHDCQLAAGLVSLQPISRPVTRVLHAARVSMSTVDVWSTAGRRWRRRRDRTPVWH